MTIEKARQKTLEQIAVMQSFAYGKKIQCRARYSEVWQDASEENLPSWNWEDADFRIKPEPTYQPYNVKTLTKAIKDHGYTVKCKNIEEYAIIGRWIESGFMFTWSDTVIPYTRLLTDWVWADDGSATGVLNENNK